MDLSKAFDSVCHNKLIKQLSKIDIKGKALISFKSYLDRRLHKVKIDNIISESKFMTSGVPPRHSIIPVAIYNICYAFI